MEHDGRAPGRSDAGSERELVRPTELLEGVGATLWESFNAMQTTRQRHFGLLEVIENRKKKYNIEASERDRTLLACLLADHDLQVRRFTAAGAALRALDSDAHQRVLTYISAINHASPAPSDSSRQTH